MKTTRLHINAIILAVLLVPLQCYLLYEANGAIVEMVRSSDVTGMAMLLSPTMALGWALKAFAGSNEGQ